MENLYDIDVTKRRISEAFLRLIEYKNFKSISITEISDEANVSRATFYRNFDSKEAIIHYHFDHLVKRFHINESFRVETDAEFEEALCYLLDVVKMNKRILKTVMELDGGALILKYLDEQYEKPYTSNGKCVPLERYLYSGAMYNVLKKWLVEDCVTPSETVAKAIRMIPRG